MNISIRNYFCTLIGVVALTLLLLFDCVECTNNSIFDDSSNPVLTMSNVNNKEVATITNLCSTVNEEIANNDSTGITVGTQVLGFKKDATSDDTEVEDSLTETNTYNFVFNATAYNKLEQKQKQLTMEIILGGIDDSQLSQISKSKIYNFIVNSDKATASLVRQLSNDVTADFASAYASFRPFTGVIGWILGILVFAIFIMLGFTILIDISYIVIPLFQNFLSSSTDKKKPRLVSPEAWNAVKTAEASIGNGYKEPLSTYLGTKTKQFLAIGICVLYLVSGQIYDLIARIIDTFTVLFS